MVSLGERLREERERLGLSQTLFGDLAQVTKKTQMLYEGGQRSPKADYLTVIAEQGVDVQYVLTGTVRFLSRSLWHAIKGARARSLAGQNVRHRSGSGRWPKL